MANNKVQLADGSVLIDITDTTAVAEDVKAGKVFYGADGAKVAGTMINRGGDPDEIAQRIYPTGEVVLDSVTLIKNGAFYANTGMTKVSSDTVTEIQAAAFALCRNLTEVSFPNVTSVGVKGDSYGFTGCTFTGCPKLQKLYFPKLATITGSRTFGQQDTLAGGGVGSSSYPATIALPALTSLSAQAFRGNGGYWAAIDLGPGVSTLRTDQFYQGTFKRLILRRTAGVVSAPAADTIKYLSNVWVPSDLITSYQTATNWSTRYNAGTITLHAIEGSEYEDAYADGTPCPQSITNTLTNVTSSNTDTSVVAGEAYSATLTADAGYTISSVTVMMKRVDVTSTVYNSSTGVVSIAEVNGPIVITATAT